MRQEPAPNRPTVGDTLTVVHRVAVPAGALVQPRGPEDSTVATLVGPPDVRREGDSVRIAYTVAVWAPGTHDLVLPGAVVVRGSGEIDTLPDAHVRIEVASVLPDRVQAESIAPRAARPWVERATASALPFAVFLLPIMLLLVAAALWWRRRGPIAPPAPPVAVDRAARIAQVRDWLERGEAALAVDHLAALLPTDGAAADWRERVAAVRFERGAEAALARLGRDGLALLGDDGPH